MNKQELEKKYQEIIMETNGNMEDYSLAICRIGTAINELEDIKDLQQQLDQQKAMWNELKEFVGKYADNYDESIPSICYLILDKIKELEGE